MKPKIRIGFVGCGQFARNFVPLFQAHPACEYVAVCDKFRDRAENYMETFHVNKIFDSYEQMLASDEINSVAIFSQRNQHGQMAIAALKAGKNVYSAVPMATSIEEIKEIIGADSLGYFPLEALPELSNGQGICSACFDGCYPTEITVETGKNKFEQKLSEID